MSNILINRQSELTTQAGVDPHIRDCLQVFTQDWTVIKREYTHNFQSASLSDLGDNEFEVDSSQTPSKPVTSSKSVLNLNSNTLSPPSTANRAELDQAVLQKISDASRSSTKQTMVSCVYRQNGVLFGGVFVHKKK
jgi:hypothetical protein